MVSKKRDIVNFAVGESYQITPVSYMHTEDEFVDDSWYFLRVQSIIGIAYKDNINQIQLMNLEVSITNLLRLLSFPSDFHTLKLFFLNQEVEKKEHVKLPPDELPCIENIIIYDCGASILKLVTYLQPDSIVSFTVKVNNFEQLDASLQKQNAVAKLSLNCLEDVPVPIDLFAGHEFTHLTLNVASRKNLSKFLPQFAPTLVYLDIMKVIDDKIFAAITKLENLSKLRVSLFGVSRNNVLKLAELQNLSSLLMYGGTSLQLESLLMLKKLRLDFFDYPECQPQDKAVVEQLKQQFSEEDSDGEVENSVIFRQGG